MMDANNQGIFVPHELLIKNFEIMIKELESFAVRLSVKQIWIVLVISFVVFMGSNVYLGLLFENTGYPVPLIEGQLRFDESLLKQDFSMLIENGTLQDYINIQYWDLSIMLSTAIFFGLLTLFIFRKNKSKYWRIPGITLSLLFPLSGLLDFIENLWLLNILDNPIDFAGWKAMVYSSFALMKLIAFAMGLVGVLIVFILSKIQFNKTSQLQKQGNTRPTIA